MFATKHTRFINRDLPQIVERAIAKLVDLWHDQDRRINAYKGSELDDSDAQDLIIRATDVGVCFNRLIPAVRQEWRERKHKDFEKRDAWSLTNAFTEALKDGNLMELPKRTEALRGLPDSAVGLGRN